MRSRDRADRDVRSRGRADRDVRSRGRADRDVRSRGRAGRDVRRRGRAGGGAGRYARPRPPGVGSYSRKSRAMFAAVRSSRGPASAMHLAGSGSRSVRG
ncbi:hypothetical protein SUDANB37_05010 [Streptomyces sp. enrichment culture]